MITSQSSMEGVSRSYVYAIASQAGINYSKTDLDYGIDGTFETTKDNGKGRISQSGFKLDFQLKATTNFEITDENISYDLEVKNYNDLIDENVGTPRVLILYVMPKNREEWIMINSISNTDDNIVYKYNTSFSYCAWWYSLKGLPESSNKETVRIKIPKQQILTYKSLNYLMEMVERGEEL